MAEKLTWDQYRAQFPQPYDLSVYVGKPLSEYPANYDEMRKANLKWHAEFIRNHARYIGPELMLNPYVRGGWFYGLNGAVEYIPDPDARAPVDWAAEAAAGRPVIGPAVAATSGPPRVGPGNLPADRTGAARTESRKSFWARVRDAFRG